MNRDPDRPWVIGHRGASAARPENTLAAFRHAYALGADAVELDVRRTADGVLVVHHDAEVIEAGPIIDLDWATLAERAPWIPTIEEAVEACAGMWINVEVKNSPVDPDWDPNDQTVKAIAEIFTEWGIADRILLSSFNLQSVVRAKQLMPTLATGWLLDRGSSPLGAVAGTVELEIDALHPHADDLGDPNSIAAAHDAGLLVITWTVDDPDEIRRLATTGVDGIITNVPGIARSALQNRDDDRN
jgi:glycerophosphoryl diester phosphodiesterase